jgi:hypothetical protein
MAPSVRLASLARFGTLIAMALLAASATAGIVVLTQASALDPYAAYPVLNKPGPSGLTTVTPGREASARGPVWGEGVGRVDIATAREAEVSTPGLRVWVARRSGGGICVLALQAGRKGPGSSCAPTTRGATIELFGAEHATFLAGVAPSGVSSVSVELSDGSVRTVPVRDDAYSLVLSASVESLTLTGGGPPERIAVGGSR